MTPHNYNAGHPWYYLLGGSIRFPREILEAVKARGYHGYMAEDMMELDAKAEPRRSEALAKLRENVLSEFRRDLSRYRKMACELRQERREQGIDTTQLACNDLHTSISLKYCHLYNDLAHLYRLDKLLYRQTDLFGF